MADEQSGISRKELTPRSQIGIHCVSVDDHGPAWRIWRTARSASGVPGAAAGRTLRLLGEHAGRWRRTGFSAAAAGVTKGFARAIASTAFWKHNLVKSVAIVAHMMRFPPRGAPSVNQSQETVSPGAPAAGRKIRLPPKFPLIAGGPSERILDERFRHRVPAINADIEKVLSRDDGQKSRLNIHRSLVQTESNNLIPTRRGFLLVRNSSGRQQDTNRSFREKTRPKYGRTDYQAGGEGS
jgi:hypothetical protein